MDPLDISTLGTGDFALDAAKRTLRGLLTPWNELSRLSVSGVPPIAFRNGGVHLPGDVSVLNANMDHDRYQPVARFVAVENSPRGLVADFAIANTPEGDKLIADHAAGKKWKLSPELRNIQRDASDPRYGTAVLTGAGFVTEGAFASAGLFAIDATSTDLPPADVPADPLGIATFAPDDAGIIYVNATAFPDTVEVTVEGEDPQQYTTTTTEEEDTTVTDAAIPEGTFGVHKTKRGVNGNFAAVRTISEALAAYCGKGDRSALDKITEQGVQGMFALNDVKTAGAITAGAIQPQFIGQLWAGRSYERRIIPLLGHADLKSFKVTGFQWGVKPVMAAWAGDKANVPSNTPTWVPFSEDAERFAGGHDIAREFRDFDVPEFWDAYFKAMTDSYAQLSDDAAGAALIAGATPIVAGVVPAGVNAGLTSIVDGALAVLATGTPAYALVAPDVFRSIALTRDVDKLAYLNTTLGLEEGTLTNFRMVPYTGLAAGKVLVGVNNAATEYELPGSPIRTEALDQIKGGIDEALFGYAATIIDNAAGLALVTPHV